MPSDRTASIISAAKSRQLPLRRRSVSPGLWTPFSLRRRYTNSSLMPRVIEWSRLIVVGDPDDVRRSEEHTSELQSRLHLVCRLLLEKKKRAALSRSGRTHLDQ